MSACVRSPKRAFHIPFMVIPMHLCYTLSVMKSHFFCKTKPFLSRLLVPALVVSLLFFSSPRALAESLSFQIGECSDDVFRVEMRLSDLGYLSGVVNGRWEQVDADALAAFADANKVNVTSSSSVLFSSDALPASSVSSVFATGPQQGFLVTYGTLMPWADVKAKLEPGKSYDVTSCYSGITLHMVCVSANSHAKMRPELDWDNATLRGFFNAASSSDKQPVVIAVDGILIAASIQQAAPSMENQPLPDYALYFSGSLTGVNGIPDAEHEAIVKIAAKLGN